MAALNTSLDVIGNTLTNWSKDAPNAIINSNGALYYFKNFGKMGLKGKNDEPMGSIETTDGGKDISIDVQMTANPNVGFVAYDETVPVVEQDAMATAVYDWKFCYGNAPISKAKIDTNSGSKFAKRNLVKTIVNVAESSMINAVGVGMWNTADADSLVGIPSLITDDGTGTVGGLATTSYDNWKNQFGNLAATHTYEELRAAMSTLYRECKTGADAPDLILMGSTLYGEFEAGLTTQERYSKDTPKSAKIAEAGFEMLKFKGAYIIEDENCPVNRAYFINTKSMGFYFHESDMFNVGEMEKKYGGMQYNFPISSTCALIAKNRRDLGVLVVAAA